MNSLAHLVTAALVAVGPAPVPVREKQWHLGFLNVSAAHAITAGEGITVALIDTGVDSGHPDLAGSILTGADPGGAQPDDLDVRRDADPGGHGTAMAGLIGAHGADEVGALGIAPGVKILPLRVSRGRAGTGVTGGISEAIRLAVARGADVISISSVSADGLESREVVDEALAAGVVVVAGVGNRPGARQVGYPAAYEGVLAVAGVDRRGRHAAFSVTGVEVDISAPAVAITTTAPVAAGSYRTADGTSSATAIVAGAAALVRAEYPHLSGPEVVARLTATADDKGAPGRDPQYGYGVLNLMNALTADVPGQPTSPPTVTAGAPPAPWRPLRVYLAALLALAATAAVAALRYRRRAARAGNVPAEPEAG